MSDFDEDTSDGYKESAAELEAEGGDDMSDEEIVHVISSDEEARERNKKKTKRPRANAPVRTSSKVWVHFHKDKRPSKKHPGKLVLKACCNYCESEYAYKQGGSTSTLRRHHKVCKNYKNKKAKEAIQANLFFRRTNAPTMDHSIEYDQGIIKELVAKMICLHEYSFRMVEHKWFNILMKSMNPNYQPIGRKVINSECMQVFHREKEVLKSLLKGVDSISLTTDLWTSNQTISYMCVVAHYIDEDWKMQTRVLAFIELDPPHSGNVIADALYVCVTEWKIENKIMSVTLDNASNNDGAVDALKAKFLVRRGADFDAQYFHVRCCAHILNLVVQDGTEVLDPLIKSLRQTVKYFKRSPSRLKAFVDTCKSLGVTVGKRLHLDCKTRWSSTYKMIKTARKYKGALT
uniref:BED-type domain-containing protein n=1 Tax=Triticum urartu TaxID=4572 RepID=A0A8R7QME6_TRIUA